MVVPTSSTSWAFSASPLRVAARRLLPVTPALHADACSSRDQIKRHAQTSQKHTYTLFLVPRTSTLATRILEEEGVLGEITVSSYNLQFIPLEDDVISIECDTAFKEIWVVSPP